MHVNPAKNEKEQDVPKQGSRSNEEASDCVEDDCCDQWRSNMALTEPCCGETSTFGRWAVQKRTSRTFIEKRQQSAFFSISAAQWNVLQ